MAAKKLILVFLLFSAFSFINVSSVGVYNDINYMISSLDQLPQCQQSSFKTGVDELKSRARSLEKSVIEKGKKLAKTQGELEELEEIIKEKKRLLREKSKLSKSLESDLQSHRAKMRRLAYEADLFSDRLAQFYGKRIPHWLGVRLFCFQITRIDELVKQSFTAMELVLFLVGALLPLLLILFFKPLSAILREKANDHSSCEAAKNQISGWLSLFFLILS